MEFLIPCAALVASLLTFISGFGLGTLLLPVLVLFFPLELAVTMTAVVHLLNNTFKFGLLWKHVNRSIVFRFGIPGIIGAWFGAMQLAQWEELPALYQGVLRPVSTTRLVIGSLMVVFALLELVPAAKKWSLPTRFLSAGGALSGFFGGLSGHQGALRSIFLLRVGMSKEMFLATGVAIALLVDLTRIPVYLRSMSTELWAQQGWLLLITTGAAMAGALLGKRLLPKITLGGVQLAVAVLLLVIAGGLIGGVI